MTKIASLLLISCLATAEPYVLGEFGPTQPITDYYDDAPNQTAMQEHNVFPMQTKMSISKSFKQQIKAEFTTPIFIVGDDVISKQWLIKNKVKLKSMNASGFLVSVKSGSSLKKMMSLYQDNLHVADGDAFYDIYGLMNYPCLVVGTEVTQ